MTSTSVSNNVAAKFFPSEVSPNPAEEKSAQSVGDVGVGEVGEVAVEVVPLGLAMGLFPFALPVPFGVDPREFDLLLLDLVGLVTTGAGVTTTEGESGETSPLSTGINERSRSVSSLNILENVGYE